VTDGPIIAQVLAALGIASALTACGGEQVPSLSKRQGFPRQLSVGDAFPNLPEAEVSGRLTAPLRRSDRDFRRLVQNRDKRIVFKNEEKNDADRFMTAQLSKLLSRLARQVEREWPGVRLRVTEAWDEEGEHGKRSLHYAGRAADLTTTDLDAGKLGRLASLAAESGFDWVFYENRTHVHVSVRR
jgi:hypothetical protein